jgi:RNA recognition motif-containing protein
MQIFIGNLSRLATPRHLAELFLPYGIVRAVKINSADTSGRSLGFGFIEMEPKCGKLAIQRLNRMLFMNAYIEVNEVS